MTESRARAAFARTIRAARGAESRLSVARRSRVNYRTWLRWEHGDCAPGIDSLPEIAAVLGVNLADLLAHWLYEMGDAGQTPAATTGHAA